MTKAIAFFTALILVGALCTASNVSAQPAVRKPAEKAAPRLVVSVVIDQLGSWIVDRYRDRLPKDGFLREAMAHGAYHERVVYEHAMTQTAVGHCTIYTGAPPSESGVTANEIWDSERHAKFYSTDDHRSSLLTTPTQYASPLRLRAEGVADVLRRETRGEGRVVSVSYKDRSAIYPGGRHPLMALWFDGKAGAYTSSTYYAFALPAWLDTWNRTRLPVFRVQTPAADKEAAEKAFATSPQSVAAMFEVATRAAAEYHLGEDDVVDLLAVSVSTTDIVGHWYGAESPQHLAMVQATDRYLAKFLKPFLERERVTVLVTADHGVPPTLESSKKSGRSIHVATPEQITRAVEAELDHRFGEKPWVEATNLPRMILFENARAGADRAALLDAVKQAVRVFPAVRDVFDTRAVRAQRSSSDPYLRAVALSVTDDDAADFYLVQNEYDLMGPAADNAPHGTPYAYDQEVPVIIYGHGVKPIRTKERTSIRRVAATLARLLRISPPASAASATVLPGVE